MRRHATLLIFAALICAPGANAQKPIALEEVMRAPFPEDLTAAKTGRSSGNGARITSSSAMGF